MSWGMGYRCWKVGGILLQEKQLERNRERTNIWFMALIILNYHFIKSNLWPEEPEKQPERNPDNLGMPAPGVMN